MKLKINELKLNKENPRIIKNKRFKQLVQSIKDFPEMLELRPIVIDEENVILGGNMRTRACIEIGLKEIPVKIAKGLTEEQKREFIIKDNANFGDWEWDILANEWDMSSLKEWGVEVYFDNDDFKELGNPDNSETENRFALEIDKESNYLVLKFNTDIDWLYAKTLFDLQQGYSKRQSGAEWNKGIGRGIDGIKAIKMIQAGTIDKISEIENKNNIPYEKLNGV